MDSREDLAGRRFGRLVAVKRVPAPAGRYGSEWLCQCDCGGTSTTSAYRLREGKTASCGCSRKKQTKADLTGQKFGELTVLRRYEGVRLGGGAHWVCRCSCGNETITRQTRLRANQSRSCGCARMKACAKLTQQIADEIRVVAEASPGMTYAEIGERYGVSQSTVSKILNDKAWTGKQAGQQRSVVAA